MLLGFETVRGTTTVSWLASRSVVIVSGVVIDVGTKRTCSAPVPQMKMTSSVPGKSAPGSRGKVGTPVRTLRSVSQAIATIVLSASRSVFNVTR